MWSDLRKKDVTAIFRVLPRRAFNEVYLVLEKHSIRTNKQMVPSDVLIRL